jgi:anti-sigma28 factor (negative regulator of flagellin synthesis)
MKVEAPKSVREIDKVAPVAERAADRSPADRITLEHAQDAVALVRAASAGAAAGRVARLAQIEASIRSGSYRPSASQIAEQLLSSAEVDARLQALLSH